MTTEITENTLVTREQIDDKALELAKLIERARFTGEDERIRARRAVAGLRKGLRSVLIVEDER